jgi:hypothetical protein
MLSNVGVHETIRQSISLCTLYFYSELKVIVGLQEESHKQSFTEFFLSFCLPEILSPLKWVLVTRRFLFAWWITNTRNSLSKSQPHNLGNSFSPFSLDLHSKWVSLQYLRRNDAQIYRGARLNLKGSLPPWSIAITSYLFCQSLFHMIVHSSWNLSIEAGSFPWIFTSKLLYYINFWCHKSTTFFFCWLVFCYKSVDHSTYDWGER